MFSIDRDCILGHMYCNEPGNVLNFCKSILKYQRFSKVVLNFKEALYFGTLISLNRTNKLNNNIAGTE